LIFNFKRDVLVGGTILSTVPSAGSYSLLMNHEKDVTIIIKKAKETLLGGKEIEKGISINC